MLDEMDRNPKNKAALVLSNTKDFSPDLFLK